MLKNIFAVCIAIGIIFIAKVSYSEEMLAEKRPTSVLDVGLVDILSYKKCGKTYSHWLIFTPYWKNSIVNNMSKEQKFTEQKRITKKFNIFVKKFPVKIACKKLARMVQEALRKGQHGQLNWSVR